MIEINNLTTNSVDKVFFKKVAEKVLAGEKAKGELSIALVGQGRIRELNKKYRKKNRVTDVLTFGENTKYKIQNTRYKIQDLGEIVLCPHQVKKNAGKYKSTFKKELTRVLIHGILHLLGEEHEASEEKAKKMEQKQEYYLNLFLK